MDTFPVPGHDSRLGQVISNLLVNAQSFSEAGGKVRIVCRRVRSEIEITIDDDGPGIREDALERIFERFYTDRPHQGFGQNSGLGLSISKQIIEAHGGRIWAENRVGPTGFDGEATIADTADEQIVVRPARELAGLIEIRGLGIRRCDFAGSAIVGLVVDLSAADAERLPPPKALSTRICGVLIPRIPVGVDCAALPLVVAALTMAASSSSDQPPGDCPKGIGNHIRHTIATE
jgi:hypothetical protein